MLQILMWLCWYWGWAIGILFVGEWLARRLTQQKEVLPRGLFLNHLLWGDVFISVFNGRSSFASLAGIIIRRSTTGAHIS